MASSRTIREFWDWFVHNEDELYRFDSALSRQRERLFDSIAAALQRVNTNLYFELGPPGLQREFVVSASGIKDVFPIVSSLVQAAPALARWRITAFRPRRGLATTIECHGKRINTDDVRFTLLDNGRMAGIELFIPGYRDDDPGMKEIGYLLLDHMLGEFDVEMRLGLIQMRAEDEPITHARHSLSALPTEFDRLLSQLERRSNQPS